MFQTANDRNGATSVGFNMLYSIAADLVVVTHFLWIVFIILGCPVFLYFNMPKCRVLHLLALIATVIMQLTRTICPLTYLEAYLKSKGESGQVYPGKFTIGAVERLIYVEDLTLKKITYITAAFLFLVLFTFWLRPVTQNKQTNVRH